MVLGPDGERQGLVAAVPGSRHRAVGIVPILVVFLILGTVYSIVTPIFEASDELWHYPLVNYLADGNGLPVQDPAAGQPWRQEGSQPPLYYFLMSLPIRLIDRSDFAQVRRLNPHADIGILTADGNRNMTVHGPLESFPYGGTALAVHLIRLLSVFMGAGTVWLTHALAREVFPAWRWVPVLGAALVAFNPMFLFISGSVNNDNLVVLLCSLALYLTVRLERDRLTAPRPALFGLVIGLGVLAKVSALALLAPAGLALTVACVRRRDWRRFLWGGALILLVAGAVSGWWLLRNRQLYGDWLGLETLVAISGPRFPQPSLPQLLGEWQGFVWSYWGLFGGLNVAMPPWAYSAYSALAIAAAVGLGISVVRPKAPTAVAAGDAGGSLPSLLGTGGTGRGFAIAILALWPAIVFVALIRWTLMTPASQGRLMFAALPELSIWMAVGLLAWLPEGVRGSAGRLIGTVFLIVAVVVPFAVIAPAYVGPPPLAEADLQSIPNRLDSTFDGRMRLVGWEIGADAVTPGGQLPVTLYWQALAAVEFDYSVFVHLLGEHDLVAAQRDTYPGRGARPTSAWRPGEIFADRLILAIPASAYAPDLAQLEVGLYDYTTGARLPATGADGGSLGDNVRFGGVDLRPRPDAQFPNPLHVNFQGEVALVGYELNRRVAAPGESLHVTLYWRALKPILAEYAVFVHVLGQHERLWAQRDAQPQEGLAPTSGWVPGTVIEDRYELTLRPDTPPDVYPIEVGLYVPGTGHRLGVLDEKGALVADRVLLAPIRVIAR